MHHMPPVPPEPGRKPQPDQGLQQPWQGEEIQGYPEQVLLENYPEAQQEVLTEEDQAPAKQLSPLMKTMLALVAVLGILLLLRYAVFTVRNIHITGLRAMTQQQAIRLSGLDRGLFYFTLKEEQVRDSINKNRYLQFESMEKIFPNALSVKVMERYPFAFFTHLGVGYVLAQDGMILEQTRDLRMGDDLILVNGLAVWGQQSPGAFPASTDPAQSDGMIALFEKLLLWGFDTQIKSIDIAQSLSISMQTDDGYTINLGSDENLHAKIGTVFSVVNALRQRQMTGGIIEATLPGEATYQAAP